MSQFQRQEMHIYASLIQRIIIIIVGYKTAGRSLVHLEKQRNSVHIESKTAERKQKGMMENKAEKPRPDHA